MKDPQLQLQFMYFAIYQIESRHCMIAVYVFRIPRNTVQV